MYQDIVPGYRVQVTTWENDCDNYNTEAIDGLDENDVRFVLHVCKLFDRHQSNSLGNEDLHGEAFVLALQVHLTNFEGTIPEDWIPDKDLDDEEIQYFYGDMLSLIGINSTEYGYWRVFDDAQVYLVPQPIQNVTKKFK